MRIKFFFKDDCPKCPAAKERVSTMGQVEYFDLGQAEGLAEAAFYSIMSTPSLVISGDGGEEVASFRGDIPSAEELSQWI